MDVFKQEIQTGNNQPLHIIGYREDAGGVLVLVGCGTYLKEATVQAAERLNVAVTELNVLSAETGAQWQLEPPYSLSVPDGAS